MSNTEDEYLEKHARNIIQPLVNAVLTDKPSEIFVYMIDYLKKLSGKNTANNMEKEELNNLRKEMKKMKSTNQNEEKEEEYSQEDSEEDEHEKDKVDELIINRKKADAVGRQRTAVSAEVYGKFNKKESFTPRIIKKNEEQIKRINQRVMMSFLFNSLEDKDLRTVIDAMEEKKYKSGMNVIKEGEIGDVLYLIDSGSLDCFKTFVILIC